MVLESPSPVFHHVGVYAYRPAALTAYAFESSLGTSGAAVVGIGLSLFACGLMVNETLEAAKLLAAEGIEIGPSPQETEYIAAYNLPIEDLNFSVRSYNCLKRQEIHSVGELAECTESDLLDIRNFGQKSINEVKIKLASLGLTLKDAPEDFDPTQIEGYDAETGTWTASSHRSSRS